MIVVPDRTEARRLTGREICALQGEELGRLPPPHGDGSAPAVQLAPLVLIVLELPKVREHPAPRPLDAPPFRPFVVVREHAAEGDGGVHRRGAAHDLAARELDLPALERISLESPVVIDDGDPGAVSQIVRSCLERPIVRSGFEEQHLATGVLGQASRQDGARRSASHDDVVIRPRHRPSLPWWPAVARRGLDGERSCSVVTQGVKMSSWNSGRHAPS